MAIGGLNVKDGELGLGQQPAAAMDRLAIFAWMYGHGRVSLSEKANFRQGQKTSPRKKG